jgi:hypothetical protein
VLFVAGLALVTIGMLVRRLVMSTAARRARSVGAVLVEHYEIDVVPAPRPRRASWTHVAGFALIVMVVLTSAGAATRDPMERSRAGSSLDSLRSDAQAFLSELRARIAFLMKRLEQLTAHDARTPAPSRATSQKTMADIAATRVTAASDVAPSPSPAVSAVTSPRLPDASRRFGAGSTGARSQAVPRPTGPASVTLTSQGSPVASSLARSEGSQIRPSEGSRSEGLVAAEIRPVSAVVVRPVLAESRETAPPTTETASRREKTEPSARSGEKIDKLVKLERVERPERPSRIEKIEKVEKPERLERIDRVEKTERPARIEKVERPSRPEKPVRPGR